MAAALVLVLQPMPMRRHGETQGLAVRLAQVQLQAAAAAAVWFPWAPQLPLAAEPVAAAGAQGARAETAPRTAVQLDPVAALQGQLLLRGQDRAQRRPRCGAGRTRRTQLRELALALQASRGAAAAPLQAAPALARARAGQAAAASQAWDSRALFTAAVQEQRSGPAAVQQSTLAPAQGTAAHQLRLPLPWLLARGCR